MEATSLSSAATIISSSSSPLSIFSPKKRTDSSPSPRIVRLSKKKEDKDYDPQHSESNSSSLVPLFRNRTLSNDEAMGLVLSAASVKGWTTGSGMEGPSLPAKPDTETVSTFPWSLFTKSPRRRMRVAFTCNVCGQRTTRAINPHAYTDGTVFVQCCGCNVFHKLVDNLNLFHEVKYYVSSSSFNYRDAKWDVSGLNLFDDDEDDDDSDAGDSKDVFPL
ncbi:Zinc finger DNL-type [Arabidopsis thaliana x Arabidopsis arenosa]|uniref:Zinc finger DNL-type n=1 Tax=Arabidopsis thaliana x Arabidopsis arenosa TaxID=1240361 RepID=A0A8T1Z1J1_9BRAS|nr:Zinc finger DNL-type [Arabidopsis thaliana x Arabidopsis arenosa]